MQEELKEDLRVVRTRKLLCKALFELLEEVPFDKISVTDICDKAMVHRATFYNHFESKEHLKMNSFSLVPKNDKSLLLINSGMAPLKPYFTGAEIPPRSRITTC